MYGLLPSLPASQENVDTRYPQDHRGNQRALHQGLFHLLRRHPMTSSQGIISRSLPPHLLRYAMVGVVCTCLQLLILQLALHVDPSASVVDNSAAFFLSAQLNFVLSDRYTWVHRRPAGRAGLRNGARRLLGFNGAAVVGLAVNAAAFAAAHLLGSLSVTAAAAVAVAASTTATYALSSHLVFRANPAGSPPATPRDHHTDGDPCSLDSRDPSTGQREPATRRRA